MLTSFLAYTGTAAADPANPSDKQIADAQANANANAAELGRLTGVLAGIDGDIARLSIAAQAALDRYDQTTRDLQAALEAVTAAQAALDTAKIAEEAAREQLRELARQAYISAPTISGGGLLVAKDPSELGDIADTRRFLAQHQSEVTAAVSRAVVESSNADATRRSAQQLAETLQVQASADKDAAIAILRENESKRAALAVQREQVNAQAAAAAGALAGLKDQRAAYDAWAAEQERQRIAEQQRQAAIAAEQQRQAGIAAEQERQRIIEQQRQQASAPPPSSGGSSAPSGSSGSSGGSTAPPSKAYAPPTDGAAWVVPINPGSYYVSSCFCSRWGTFHWGTDLAASLGTPIMAIGDGTVIASGPASGFGNWVVIDHHNGYVSIYGHMRILNVSRGQEVRAGQLIAYVGSEGESTGAHLHLEIRTGIGGTAYDPEVWLAVRGVYL
ncbi:MAG: rane protein [Pseudonocardiales bacterium]|nr:rane protein [Pseudonocardiales bacterium]